MSSSPAASPPSALTDPPLAVRTAQALAVGGDRAFLDAVLRGHLQRHGIRVVAHWDYSKQPETTIPKAADLVVIFTDMVGHKMHDTAVRLAKAAKIPVLRTVRKYAQMKLDMEQQGFYEIPADSAYVEEPQESNEKNRKIQVQGWTIERTANGWTAVAESVPPMGPFPDRESASDWVRKYGNTYLMRHRKTVLGIAQVLLSAAPPAPAPAPPSAPAPPVILVAESQLPSSGVPMSPDHIPPTRSPAALRFLLTHRNQTFPALREEYEKLGVLYHAAYTRLRRAAGFFYNLSGKYRLDWEQYLKACEVAGVPPESQESFKADPNCVEVITDPNEAAKLPKQEVVPPGVPTNSVRKNQYTARPLPWSSDAEMVEVWRASGLSVKKFAKTHNLPPSTTRERLIRGGATMPPAPQFAAKASAPAAPTTTSSGPSTVFTDVPTMPAAPSPAPSPTPVAVPSIPAAPVDLLPRLEQLYARMQSVAAEAQRLGMDVKAPSSLDEVIALVFQRGLTVMGA